MSGVKIKSEDKTNEVMTDSGAISNHCVVIIEQETINAEDPAPMWRVGVGLTVRPMPEGYREKIILNTIVIGPLINARQVVAIAKFPGDVDQWTFWFESDLGRLEATVWLVPGRSDPGHCGLFSVPFPPVVP